MAMLAGLAAIASACSPDSPTPVDMTRTIVPVIPASAREKCAAPVALPDRAMPAAEIVPAWGADRAALRNCEQRRAAAVAAIDATGKDAP